jgi:hypothetical protein
LLFWGFRSTVDFKWCSAAQTGRSRRGAHVTPHQASRAVAVGMFGWGFVAQGLKNGSFVAAQTGRKQ